MKELIDLCDQYLEKTNEFVFQTRLGNFPSILHYYLASSKLHFSDGTCPIKFSQVRLVQPIPFPPSHLCTIQELSFWGISTLHLETCCLKKYLDIQAGRESGSYQMFYRSEAGGGGVQGCLGLRQAGGGGRFQWRELREISAETVGSL